MSSSGSPEQQSEIFLKARQVRARYGECSNMWLHRRMKDGGFPAPIYIGGLRFWKQSDLERWERERQLASKPCVARGMKAARAVR